MEHFGIHLMTTPSSPMLFSTRKESGCYGNTTPVLSDRDASSPLKLAGVGRNPLVQQLSD